MVIRDLGAYDGVCACCGAAAQLRLRESRLRRGAQLRGFDPQVSRTATCSVCRQTYPVRSTDARPDPAARRKPDAVRTTRRTGQAIGAGRDWVYPRAG